MTASDPTTPPVTQRLPGQPWELDSAAGFFHVCRKTLDRHIRLGRIATIRIGRRVLIPNCEMERISQVGLVGG